MTDSHALNDGRNFPSAEYRFNLLSPALLAMLLVLVISLPLAAQEDAAAIIQKSVQVSDADWKAAPQYDHCERDLDEGSGSKTYQVLMIAGSPYERLVAINGKPLSAAAEAEHRRKLQSVIDYRKNEPQNETRQRLADYEKSRQRENTLMQQLVKAFDFQLDGKQTVNGHEAYKLNATPRQGYRPPNNQAQVLTGMKGTLWIDTNTFQWVKVEAKVVHPVSIEGFLARVNPGTRFELEKKPVSEDIWLPSHFSMKAKAKIFFLIPHNSSDNEYYFDYRKAGDSPVMELSQSQFCRGPRDEK